MREIKFRAWDKWKKKWIPEDVWAVCNWPSGREQAVMIKDWEDYKEGEYFYPENEVVMQFTGLTDKNGKEIYEGDIIRYRPYSNLGHQNEKVISDVKWGETGDSDGYSHGKHYEWVVGDDSLADVADSDYPEEAYCEVIGNVHENPDLIKNS